MFLVKDNKRKVIDNFDIKQTLEDGIYNYKYDPFNAINEFTKMEFNSDEIIDIPTSSYTETLNEFKKFVLPETKLKYAEYGFLYKKSLVLHGPAGTGKTVLVQRVAKEFIKDGAVVVFNPNPQHIEHMYEALRNQPETTLIIVLEEFDKIVERNETGLLTILDGEEQRPNTIFLMTTNHLERIPKRILRPSRVSNIVYVGMPEYEARLSFLKYKKVEDSLAKEIASKTEGFTIDEIKEIIVGHIILDNSLDIMVKRVKEYKGVLNSGESSNNDIPVLPPYDKVISAIQLAMTEPVNEDLNVGYSDSEGEG